MGPVDKALWGIRRRFGVAGGPDELYLTDAGLARAFSVGARVKMGAPAQALEALFDEGGEGQFSERGEGAKVHPTTIGKFDQVAWGHLRSLQYVESSAPDGVRLTERGRLAVQDGIEERRELLKRVQAAHGDDDLEDPRIVGYS